MKTQTSPTSPPDQLHLRVPKDRKKNLEWRAWVLEQARHSREVRDGLFAACKADPLFYLNGFVWTFDPRTASKSLPFISWAYQDRAIRFMLQAITDSQQQGGPNADVVIEKSRDMGASWLSLFVMEYLWHFWPGNSFLMISRVADLVDKPGDPDALFWKLDFIHDNLPEWLMPEGWERKRHRLKMHYENPANGSTIDGYATTGAAGVGGRRTAMFIDEFSRIDAAQELLAGTADTTRCRVFNFTPWGTGHASYRLAKRPDVRKLRLGWWEHPEKNAGLYRYNPDSHQREYFEAMPDGTLAKLPGPKVRFADGYEFVDDGVLRSPVYDAEDRRRANRREMAQMWDIDYAGSTYQVYPKSLILDVQRQFATPPVWEGEVVCDEQTGTGAKLIAVKGGPLRLWVKPIERGGVLTVPPGVYVAGADVSEGTGATNSCLSIADRTRREKVAEFATPFLGAEKFAAVCVALCRLFKNSSGDGAYLVWELQGPGVRFSKVVRQLGYWLVWLRRSQVSITEKPSDTPGWVPTPDNKRTLHGEYRHALATRGFVNRSSEALEECLLFVTTPTGGIEHSGSLECDDPTGAGVNHGDRVVADALANMMCGPVPLKSAEPKAGDVPVNSLAWRRKVHEDRERQTEVW